MNNIKARQYTQAIYDIADENNQIKDYLNLSLAIIDVGLHNDKLFSYLGHPEVDPNDKKEIISDLTSEYEYYKNWLYVIIDSGKSKYIKEYINDFIKIYNEQNNIIKGYVWTTEPIDKELSLQLEKLVSKKIDKKVMLENRINKEIIGGIKLEVGDNVWDNSIKNKLMQLLKEGSEKNG